MKKQILTVSAVLFLLSYAHGQQTMSGGVDGGGGKGILCGNQLSTLDLYEARRNGIQIPENSGTFEELLGKYGVEVARHFAPSTDWLSMPDLPSKMKEVLIESIVSKFQDIRSGQRLPLTNDATIPQLPANCSVVQIAIYRNDGVIERDPEYWKMLSPIEQVALTVHEMVYHRAREYAAAHDSDETRKVLGLLFSGSNPEPILSPLWTANEKLWCRAGNSGTLKEVFEFFVIDERRGSVEGVGVYFRIFKNMSVSSRTSAFLPGIKLDQFISSQFDGFKVPVQNSLMGKTWNLDLAPISGYLDNLNFLMQAYGDVRNTALSQGSCRLE